MSVIDKIIKENKLKEVEEPKTQEVIIEKDERGNIIHYKNSNGYEYWREYDSTDNVTKRLELRHGIYYLNGKELIKEE